MKYLIKPKHFAWGHEYLVRDENGNDAFCIKEKTGLLSYKFSIKNVVDQELSFIKQKSAWSTSYQIYRMDKIYATIRYKSPLIVALGIIFGKQFVIDMASGDRVEAKGNVFNLTYSFTNKEGLEIAKAIKRWPILSNYTLAVMDGADNILLLSGMIAILMTFHNSGF